MIANLDPKPRISNLFFPSQEQFFLTVGMIIGQNLDILAPVLSQKRMNSL